MNPRVVAAVCVVAWAIVALAPPAGAVDGVTSGWWWREQPDGGTLPAPPHVPAGGLRVASDATGPSAVAAVRMALSPGEASPVLTLKVAAGSTQETVISACPVKAPWTAASAGPWSSRPEPDCSGGAAVGAPGADRATVVFDLASLPVPADGVYDIVLFPSPLSLPVSAPLPAPAPSTTWPTFDVAFAAPTNADVAATPGAAGSGGADTAPALPDPVFDLGTTTMLETPLGVALDLGLLGSPPATSPAPDAASSPADRRAPATAVASLPQLVSSWDRVGEARDRLLAAFVFVDLLAGWWWLERRRAKLGLDVGARPRITLHDDPAAVLAAHAARLVRRPPGRDIPPLR